MVLLEGMQWDASDAVVQKLKEMLWRLQALRIFDLKLDSAIAKIQEARKSLEDTIDFVSQVSSCVSGLQSNRRPVHVSCSATLAAPHATNLSNARPGLPWDNH